MIRVRAVTLLDALLLTRNGPGRPHPEGGLPGTFVVHGDRSFDYHDADLVLFGVTVESSCRTTQFVLFDVADSFISGRGANVVHELAIMVARFRRVVLWAFTDVCRLQAHAQEVSGMSLQPTVPLALPPDSSTSLLVLRVRPPPPLLFH